jgi:ubiquinone/menaquinone biosynthesis C-methylase UbiE/uncharacterized protein YbaR (Trm112 family)
MKTEYLKFLACPYCKCGLSIYKTHKQIGDSIETGVLHCLECDKKYDIVNFIPRFVTKENYASNFGFEWTKHSKTQYDSFNGTRISEERFFRQTKWPRNLAGQIILEVGSGSGRFTEQAAATGATVISMDYSYAVDANYASNGRKDNIFIVQADIYNMPFRENSFDKVFCFGVLQHTPEVKKSFFTLLRYLKSKGSLAIDVYHRRKGLKGFSSKYLARPFTKKIASERLYRYCRKYVEFMWPLATVFSKIPKLGKWLNWQLLVADYRGILNLSEEMLKEWAILDTFDMLSPAYDYPQTIETIEEWLKESNLVNTEVCVGEGVIEGRGDKP